MNIVSFFGMIIWFIASVVSTIVSLVSNIIFETLWHIIPLDRQRILNFFVYATFVVLLDHLGYIAQFTTLKWTILPFIGMFALNFVHKIVADAFRHAGHPLANDTEEDAFGIEPLWNTYNGTIRW